MTDWTAAMKIAGSGFVSIFIVLVTLAVSIWIVSLVVRMVGQKTTKSSAKSKLPKTQSSAEQPQSPTHGETGLEKIKDLNA